MAVGMRQIRPNTAADMKWCLEVFWGARLAASFPSEAPRSQGVPDPEVYSSAAH